MLQLLITPQKIIRVRLGHNLPRIWLLHKILISLLLHLVGVVLVVTYNSLATLIQHIEIPTYASGSSNFEHNRSRGDR